MEENIDGLWDSDQLFAHLQASLSKAFKDCLLFFIHLYWDLGIRLRLYRFGQGKMDLLGVIEWFLHQVISLPLISFLAFLCRRPTFVSTFLLQSIYFTASSKGK